MKRFVSRRNGRPACNIGGVNMTVARLRAELVDRRTLKHFKAFCGNRCFVRKLDHGGLIMRWFHMAVICVFAAAVIIFAAQNLQIVTISFLGFSAEVRLALLAAGIYLLGAFTGGSLLALLRQSIEGAQRRTAGTP
jgi:uncharacterized integral membrane protein